MKILLICSAIISFTHGDVYLHNPGGSNNRLYEATRPRKNANRLFDSQNNNRGGYNVGSLYYYAGSKLPIEWTNQHSCQSPNNHCDLIVQYMCSDQLCDGAVTDTIPEKRTDCAKYDCNSDKTYGMHEDYDYYINCKLRQRNMGLYTADQKVNRRNTARYTRQNPNGKRYGYECPEEHDYYPYWHPSPWKDIAVMTNDATRCPYYQAESENVKGRWACIIPKQTLSANVDSGLKIPNNKNDCEKFRWPKNDPNGVRGTWTQISSHGLAMPECQETEFTRDNHLGNGLSGYPNMFNWTVPDISAEQCIMRIRYNISTADYNKENTSALHNNGQPSELDLSTKYGFPSKEAAKARGYQFKNNPEVKVFSDTPFTLRLAINTAQFGRTFQDRTHTFSIHQRPAELKDKTIHNVNVRGKRGNIVQVYPAVEYDFVPNTLEASINQYIHFQWTGSNTNPANNDGQGLTGSDRSNVILQQSQTYPEGSGIAYTTGQKYGHWGRSYPAHLQNTTFLGLSKDDFESLAILKPGQLGGSMDELNDAGTYYNLAPRKITQTGTYHYMSTRNNNFSNRSQKGKIIVSTHPATLKSIGWNGGTVTLESGNAGMLISRGTLNQLSKFKMEEWSPEEGEQLIKAENRKPPYGDSYASNYIMVNPSSRLTPDGKSINMKMKVKRSSGNEIVVYQSSGPGFSTWVRMDGQVQNDEVSFNIQGGGLFVARAQKSSVGMIVGIVVACLVVAFIVVAIVVYFRQNPNKLSNLRGNMRNVNRSMANKI